MRRPLTQPKPFGRSPTLLWPAPIQGVRSDKGLTQEQPGAAIRLRNWICETDAVSIRKGFASFSTGMDASPIKTIMTYYSGTTSKMFGVVDDNIFDITSGGAVGAAAVTGRTQSYCSYVNFTTTAGAHYLATVNGADDGKLFDGSAWTTMAVTGVSDNDLIYVFTFKNRMWFIEKNSDSLWYLGVGAIVGAATEFPIHTKKGGRLVAGGSWSVDSGTDSGLDDMLVVITSEGEAIVYEMANPSDPATILLKGVYDIGRPLGQRCLTSFGGDMLVLTFQGLIPLSKVVTIDKSTADFQAVTSPIRKAFADDAANYGANQGWETIIYPKENLGIINVPITASAEYKQWCWNLLTGAFSDFEGVDAVTWALFGEDLYFGGISSVAYLALTGSADGTAPIQASLVTTFSQMGAVGRIKKPELIRPIVDASLAIRGGIEILTNYEFDSTTPSNATGTIEFGGLVWNTSDWNEEVWAGAEMVREWTSGMDIGDSIALHFGVTVETDTPTTDLIYRLIAFNVVYQVGGILGG